MLTDEDRQRLARIRTGFVVGRYFEGSQADQDIAWLIERLEAADAAHREAQQNFEAAHDLANQWMDLQMQYERREKALRAAAQAFFDALDDEAGPLPARETLALRGLLAEEDTPAVPLGLTWTGEEWMFACGCALHPDDRNNTHGGAPHVHSERCPVHGVKG